MAARILQMKADGYCVSIAKPQIWILYGSHGAREIHVSAECLAKVSKIPVEQRLKLNQEE